MTKLNQPNCPLCTIDSEPGHHAINAYHQDKKRSYWHCNHCDLVFVPQQFQLDLKGQKAIYDLHENHDEDEHYRRFLSRIMKHLVPRLQPKAVGLDFGCGPNPVLAKMFEEQGFVMEVYDPIYRPNANIRLTTYDFVTATEVVEHFTDPNQHLSDLWQCVRPGGWLGIMTKMVLNPTAFKNWHYIRDPTHVAFFSRTCFHWLAAQWGSEVFFYENDVILIHKAL